LRSSQSLRSVHPDRAPKPGFLEISPLLQWYFQQGLWERYQAALVVWAQLFRHILPVKEGPRIREDATWNALFLEQTISDATDNTFDIARK
jgi:hypothetical protein